MDSLRIVVLSRCSIFADGIARRLAERADVEMVQLVDASQDEALDRVRELEPSMIIIDQTDMENHLRVPVACILSAVPGAKLVQVNPNNDQIVIFTSVEMRASRVHDLVTAVQELPMVNH